jgi:hypothetical protein
MRPLAALAPLFAAIWLAAPADAAAQPPEPVQQQEAVPRAPEAPREAPVRAPQPAPQAQAPSAPAASPPRGEQQSGEQPRAQRRPPSGGDGSAVSGPARGEQRAVPRSRPREERPVVGRATPRVSPPPQAARPVYVYRSPGSRWYSPYGYGAFGVGYFYYDPWAWSPYGYGYGGYGGYQRYGGPYGHATGNVRLRVTPRDAEVLVDGYYAGIVDDFDGMFQSLKLDTGAYRIEIRKPGHETLVFDVHVQHGRTITFRGELLPVP